MTKVVHPYQGNKASLLTQHGKEAVICPELLASSGIDVVHISHYDTDQLGSFTREIARYGSQLDAVRKKARIGMELSGLPLGMASEGAFASDPFTGMMPWNYELVMLVDDIRQLEIVGYFGGQAQSASKQVRSWEELNVFLRQAQFPSHHLVVRPDDQYHPQCRKGISSIDALREAFDWAQAQSANAQVFVENDLRAHTNPTRMTNILLATQDLSKKINSLCPHCHVPGYWISDIKKGLPCSCCLSPTDLPVAQIWSCQQCHFKEERAVTNQRMADPSRCSVCNP